MSCGGATHCSMASRFLGQPSRFLAILLLGSWPHVCAVSAAEIVDCVSINMGRLDVALARGSSTLRTVEMNEGDTLAFTFRADTRATGTITLVAGGREQRLLYGPDATQIAYTAERSGAVDFRFTTKGGKLATFVTTCTPAHGPGAMALDGLNVDMSVQSSFGATASKDSTATTVATPNTLTLEWLGGERPGKEAPAGAYGVKLNLQPALMIGVLAQFDQTSDPLLGPSALSDRLWQAGPVTSLQLGAGFSLNARAAWGPTDPVTGHPADRQTLDARLTSKQEAGPWHFSPSIGFAHVQERLGAAAEHSAVPSQDTVGSGRVDVKPEMAYRMEMGHSMYIEPKVMVGTVWNLGDAAIAGTAPRTQYETRHMAETGITFGTADGTKLQVGGGVQEGEAQSDNVWSGKMQLKIPLK
jgi:hypothetical protein